MSENFEPIRKSKQGGKSRDGKRNKKSQTLARKNARRIKQEAQR